MLLDPDVSHSFRITALSETNEDEVVNSTQAITAAERARHIGQAIHNSNTEGMEASQQAILETYDYISGEINAETLVARVRALHGLER